MRAIMEQLPNERTGQNVCAHTLCLYHFPLSSALQSNENIVLLQITPADDRLIFGSLTFKLFGWFVCIPQFGTFRISENIRNGLGVPCVLEAGKSDGIVECSLGMFTMVSKCRNAGKLCWLV